MDAYKELDEIFENLEVNTESEEETNKKIKQDCLDNGITFHCKDTDKERAEKIFYGLTEDDRKMAAELKVVPLAYRDAKFDEDKITRNISKYYIRTKGLYKTYKLKKYLELCNGILSAIRMKELPKRSYIIGAPSGFGKDSFVSECLITLHRHGYRVAPYISLWELAEIRKEDEKILMNPYEHPRFKMEEISIINKTAFLYDNPNSKMEYTSTKKICDYNKTPGSVTGLYSYSEYINTDCLFVSLSGTISKELESYALKQLLMIRGAKGLPTIVMTAESLDPYKNDPVLREHVWNEILAYDEDDGCYDKLYHVSCYRLKNISIDKKDIDIDKNTGVVLGE